MQELITKLTEKAGINADQAAKVIETVKEFVKEKMPMMAGSVDNLFAGTGSGDAASSSSEGLLDKISDVIPGEMGQKVEDLAKNAADKAGDAMDIAKDKLSSFMK